MPDSLAASMLTWWPDGACRGHSTELFYAEDRAAKAEAKKVCAGCPVSAQCRQWALDTQEAYGVWGGLTWPERRAKLSQGRPDPTLDRLGSTGPHIPYDERLARLGVSHQDIRVWAKARGLRIPDRGRIPLATVAAFEDAHAAELSTPAAS